MILWFEYWYRDGQGEIERLHIIKCDSSIIFAVCVRVCDGELGIKVLSIEECESLTIYYNRVVMDNYKLFIQHSTVRIDDQYDLANFFSSLRILTITGPYLELYNKVGLLLAL